MSAVEDNESAFRNAVKGLIAGDFSRLEPLFEDWDGRPCRIIEWCEAGMFASEPKALDEALSCACFVGRPNVLEYLLNHGVSPEGGSNTGVNGFHWAANRGQLEVVRLLIDHGAPLESRNMYGGTVLGMTVWSALNEPKPNHVPIIEALIKAGANVDDVGYPSGKQAVDEVFRRFMAT
jgi:Ankyrin repeats (3 copies)